MYSPRWLWDRAKENQTMLEAPFHLATPGWPVLSLGDACEQGGGDIQTGPFGSQLHASDYVEEGIPSIMPKNIADNRVITDDIAHITEDDALRLSRYLVKPGDIVYSRRGDIEKRALIREAEAGWLCGTGCLRVRPGDGDLDSVYLSYYLAHPAVRNWIVQHAIGATMPNLNTSILSNLPVVVPSPSDQRRIAHILGTLDDKIELNRRMNRMLDAIARAIFNSWFVNFDPVRAKGEGREPVGMDPETAALFPGSFEDSTLGKIPKGWEVAQLDELANIRGGKQLPTEECKPIGMYPVFGANGIMGYSERMTNEGFVIAFGRVGAYCGSVYWTYGGAWINNNASSVVPSHWPEFVLQAMLATDFERLRTGSAQPFIPNRSLASLQVVRAPDEVLDKFCAAVRSLRLKEYASQNESRALAALRDTLLPKLISGDLWVKDAEWSSGRLA